MRVIVCGSRACEDREGVIAMLERYHAAAPITYLLHGNAYGVDSIARDWGLWKHGITVIGLRAEWEKYGRHAGPIRNNKMLTAFGKIDLVIAYVGGKGTRNMVKQARAAGVECVGPGALQFVQPDAADRAWIDKVVK